MTPHSCEHESGGSRPWQRLTGILVTVTLVGLVIVCSPASAVPRSKANGRIAFDSLRSGNGDIYLIDAPTTIDPETGEPVGTPAPDTTLTPLTSGPAPDAKPSWSGGPGVGGREDRGTPPDPRPTPAIAFQRTLPDGSTDIYRVGAPLTLPPSGPPPAERVTSGSTPAWAPELLPGTPVSWALDPSTPEVPDTHFIYPPIAFERTVRGKRDIWIANFDGTEETNLTDSDADDANPEWSPASVVWSSGGEARAYLTFDSDRGGSRELWVMELRYNPGAAPPFKVLATRPATSGQLSGAGPSVNPSWFAFTNPDPTIPNPDPTNPDHFPDSGDLTDSVAFAGPDQEGGGSHIHTADYARYDSQRTPTPAFSQIDRVATFTLTTGAQDDTAPAWSPTGDRIAFQSNRNGNSNPDGKYEIYVTDPSAQNETGDVNLTQSPGDDRNPAWEAPEGKFRDDETRPIRPIGRRKRRPRFGRAASVTPSTPSGGAVGGGGVTGGSRGGGGDGRKASRPCRKTGTAGDDLLCGTPNRDVLRGKGGNDRILGRGGNDILLGGAGKDRILGGPGRDRIRGDAGDDHLDGGRGRDNIGGGLGRDRIEAKDRTRDTVAGGPGRDPLIVDRGLDRIIGAEDLRR